MSFISRNHPQQVGVRGALDSVDERVTPEWLFERYNTRFGFTLDVAANWSNHKTSEYFSLDDDGLSRTWAPHHVWCNPPYSKIAPWVAKANAEFDAGCPVIVMLLPANRTEQAWWQELIEPHRDQFGRHLRTEFLPRRINFGRPGNAAGKYNSSAPFGCVAVIWQRNAADRWNARAGGEKA